MKTINWEATWQQQLDTLNQRLQAERDRRARVEAHQERATAFWEPVLKEHARGCVRCLAGSVCRTYLELQELYERAEATDPDLVEVAVTCGFGEDFSAVYSEPTEHTI